MKRDPEMFEHSSAPSPLESWPDREGSDFMRGLLVGVPLSALLWAGIIYLLQELGA